MLLSNRISGRRSATGLWSFALTEEFRWIRDGIIHTTKYPQCLKLAKHFVVLLHCWRILHVCKIAIDLKKIIWHCKQLEFIIETKLDQTTTKNLSVGPKLLQLFLVFLFRAPSTTHFLTMPVFHSHKDCFPKTIRHLWLTVTALKKKGLWRSYNFLCQLSTVTV